MKIASTLALCVAGAVLGGCAVTSKQPLFAPELASRHPLKDGLWALSGPGCDVKPMPAGQALPECVGMTMTVAGSHLNIGVSGPSVGVPDQVQQAVKGSKQQSGDFVLVDGDPEILEIVPSKPQADGASMPAPQSQGSQPVSYMALRSLEQDGAGHIVKGILWSVPCPDKPGAVPGIKAVGASTELGMSSCEAETAEAVRTQAPHMKPFMSFFFTWVR